MIYTLIKNGDKIFIKINQSLWIRKLQIKHKIVDHITSGHEKTEI